MNISEAAQQTGLSAKMIRHYEDTGLINPVHRSDAGYRQFSARDIDKLRFIRQARLLGFSIQQIDELIQLWQNPQRTSREVQSVARQHLNEVHEKLTELQHMKQALEQMIEACRGDNSPACAILDGLSPRTWPGTHKPS